MQDHKFYALITIVFFIICFLIGLSYAQVIVENSFTFTVNEQAMNGSTDDSSFVFYVAPGANAPNAKCDTVSVAGLLGIPKVGNVVLSINISAPDTAYTALDNTCVKVTPQYLVGGSFISGSQSFYIDHDAMKLVAAKEYVSLTETNVLSTQLTLDPALGMFPCRQFKVNLWRMDAGAAVGRDYTITIIITNNVNL